MKLIFGKIFLLLTSCLPEMKKIGKITFFRFSHFLRRSSARMISKNVSKKANIHKGVKITGFQNKLTIEEHGALGINCLCNCGDHVFIGKHTMMGPNCVILTQNHKFEINEENDNKCFSGYTYNPVYIGEYTWIGRNVIILPGAKIGKGCIVGAGSVVTNKEFPDYSLIAGNPAVVKKMLK